MEDTRRALSAGTAGIVIVTWLVFLLFRERLGMSDLFFNWFAWIGGAAVLVVVISYFVDWIDGDSFSSLSFNLWSSEEERPFSGSLMFPLIILVISLFVVLTVVSNQQAGIFVPANPFSADSLAWEGAVSGSGFSAQFLGSWVPAWFEDLAVLGIIMAGTFLTVSLLGLFNIDLKSVSGFLTVSFVWTIAAAAVFSLAHMRYAGNEAAFAWAFLYALVLQTMNVWSGAVISPVVHFAHNFVVISNQFFALVAFQVALPVLIHKDWFSRYWAALLESFAYLRNDFKKTFGGIRNGI